MTSSAAVPATPRRALLPRGAGRPALAGLLFATAALAAGCSGAAATSAASSAAAPACKQPAPASLPHSAGSLAETSTGAYCLQLGQRIDVFLTASSPETTPANRWDQVASSDPAVLTPDSTAVLTAPLGVTPGIFLGAVRGTAVLSSRTPGGSAWQVTVVVR